MPFTKSLSAISKDELSLVGRKALDLAVLQEQRFAVPDSFVILSSAFATLMSNGIKHKLEFLMRHIDDRSPQSLMNVYTSVRKAIGEYDLADMESEFVHAYEQLAKVSGQTVPVRVMLSTNFMGNPENNDTVIQNVRNPSEFLLAVREAWALTYLPNQLAERRAKGVHEKDIKVALLVQVMDTPDVTVHVHSDVPQDPNKLYLEAYYGYPDLREKITKDYYAIDKESLQIVDSEVHEQPERLLMRDGELARTATGSKAADDKIIRRGIEEIARLTKKASRTLQTPVKAFFSCKDETYRLLWVNRYSLSASAPAVEIVDIPQTEAKNMVDRAIEDVTHEEDDEGEVAIRTADPEDTAAPEAALGHAGHAAEEAIKDAAAHAAEIEHTIIRQEAVQPTRDPSMKLLAASLRLAVREIERKYEQLYGQSGDDFSEMIRMLNQRHAFSRQLDADLLRKANDAVRDGTKMDADEHAGAIDEITFLLMS